MHFEGKGQSTEQGRSRAPQGKGTSPSAAGHKAPARRSFLPVAAAAGGNPLPPTARAGEACCLGQGQELQRPGGTVRGRAGGSKGSTGRIRARRAGCHGVTHGSLPSRGRGGCPTHWESTGTSPVLDPDLVSAFLVVLYNLSNPLALTIEIAGTQGPTQTAPEACEPPESQGGPGRGGDTPGTEGAANSS